MTLSDVLSIALALAFTYTVVSMLATIVKEAIAAKLQWRAKDLEQGILSMLETPTVPADAVAAFKALDVYNHPLVSGLATAERAVRLLPAPGKPRPSYVPARNFTLALVDILRAGSKAPVFTAVETAIDKLPDCDLKTRLLVFANEAGGDVDALKSQFDKWFDDTMDRISGAYKRRSQLVLLIIGAVMAVTMNVDTIGIVSSLQNDDLRASVAANITAVAADQTLASAKNFADLADRLKESGVPIGWSSSNRFLSPLDEQGFWTDVVKLFGLILTAGAVSLGAPFWFDILNQLVSLRSSGPKPPRADDPDSNASSSTAT